MIDIVRGNILDANVEALVNTVNTQGVMGKGLALQFKKVFPEMFEAYAKACKAGEVDIGKLHVFHNEDLLSPKYIINFPTKKTWKASSRLEYVESGLKALVQIIKDNNISSIAIPPLGCGYGGLQWSKVQPLIESYLSPITNVKILVYPPNGNDYESPA